MQVHQVVNNPTLQVILDSIDDALFAHVHNLEVCEIVLGVINCLIDLLIIANAVSEILGSLLGVLANVVWRSGLDLKNVAHNEIFIVALALNEQCLNTLLVASLLDPSAALLCAVGGIENGNDSVLLLEPENHIVDGSLRSCTSDSFTFGIIDIEEIGGGLGSALASVVTHVEDLGVDREPL